MPANMQRCVVSWRWSFHIVWRHHAKAAHFKAFLWWCLKWKKFSVTLKASRADRTYCNIWCRSIPIATPERDISSSKLPSEVRPSTSSSRMSCQLTPWSRCPHRIWRKRCARRSPLAAIAPARGPRLWTFARIAACLHRSKRRWKGRTCAAAILVSSASKGILGEWVSSLLAPVNRSRSSLAESRRAAQNFQTRWCSRERVRWCGKASPKHLAHRSCPCYRPGSDQVKAPSTFDNAANGGAVWAGRSRREGSKPKMNRSLVNRQSVQSHQITFSCSNSL